MAKMLEQRLKRLTIAKKKKKRHGDQQEGTRTIISAKLFNV